MFICWWELRCVITAGFLTLHKSCCGRFVEAIMAAMWAMGFHGMSEGHLNRDLHFHILFPFLLPSLTPCLSWRVCQSSQTQMTITAAAKATLKRSEGECQKERLSPPSISDPDSTVFFTSPLPSVKGASSAVTKIAFYLLRFDKWPISPLKCNKMVK